MENNERADVDQLRQEVRDVREALAATLAKLKYVAAARDRWYKAAIRGESPKIHGASDGSTVRQR